MTRSICAVVVGLGAVSVATGQVADFEEPGLAATPFTSGGLDFVGDGPNLVFPAPGIGGANNGTTTFGWCGSSCTPAAQMITVTTNSGLLFDMLSIDAGNLSPRGNPLGYVEGMTLELVGYQMGGVTVTESLLIRENMFTTFALTGFTNLTRLEMFAPAVGGGNPDPVVDNLVYRPIPAPSSVAVLALCGLVGVRRKR